MHLSDVRRRRVSLRLRCQVHGEVYVGPARRIATMDERIRAALRRTYFRVRSVLGYIDNVAWLRATLNRRVAVDEARAHLAVHLIERTLEERRPSDETRHDRS